MKQYTLHIKDQLVATLDPSRSGVSADYEIMDASSLSDRKSNRTQQLLSPATDLLQQMLGFPENYSSIDAINQNQLIIGELKEDGETIISGKIKYHGATIEGLNTFYRLSIIGDNNVWAYQLSNKRLRHLDLYDETHAWTQANQEASESNNTNKTYCYPLIQTKNLGKFHVHSAWSQNNDANTEFQIKGNIYPNDFIGSSIELLDFEHSDYNKTFSSSSYTVQNLFDGVNSRIIINGLAFNGDYGDVRDVGYIRIVKSSGIKIRTTDRYPVLRVSTLIEKIFNSAGYHIQSNYNANVLSKLWFAYEMNYGWAGQRRFKDFALFRAGNIVDKTITFLFTQNKEVVPLDDTDSLKNFDNGNFFNKEEFSYQPKIIFKQKFYAALSFDLNTDSVISFFIESVNWGVLASSNNQSYAAGFNTVSFNTLAFTLIDVTDEITIKARVHPSNLIALVPELSFRKGNCAFYNEIRFEPKKEGENIYLVQHLPDISQLDLVRSIIQSHGLMIMTDTNTKTIYIENYDNFIDRTKIVDWRDRTDISKKIEDDPILKNPPAGILFKWVEDDNDVDTTVLKTKFDIVYGSHKVDYASQFKSLKYDEYTNDLLAASYSSTAVSIGINKTKVTRIITENNSDIHVARCLHYDGPVSLQSGESWMQGTNTRITAPLATFQDDTNSNNHSLHYENGLFTIGLVDRNFGTLQKEINESRLITIYLRLNAFDIAQFVNIDNELKRDFRSVFLIKNLHGEYLCRLVKIGNYNKDNASTKCSFIPLV